MTGEPTRSPSLRQTAPVALGSLDLGAIEAARWFGARGRRVVSVELVDAIEPPDADGAALVVCDLADDAGGVIRASLPLRDGQEAAPDDPLWAALARLAARSGVSVSPGPGRALASDLTNTAVVLGEQLVVKAIRLADEGRSAEAEALEALDTLDGVPGYRGSLWCGGSTVIVLQDHVASVESGWESFIERLVALAVGEVGAADHTTALAHALGSLTGRIHLRLAERLGVTEATPGLLADRHDRAVRALDTLCVSQPEVAPRAQVLRARLALLADAVGAPLIRIHGDLHVGQTLVRADGSPVIVDFDGEPGRPLAERVAPWTPLQDVASLRLSLDNAVAAAARRCRARGIDPTPLGDWADTGRDSVLAGWLGALTAGRANLPITSPLISVLAWYEMAGEGLEPGRGRVETLLGACEALKQIAELEYAERFLPEWLYAPLETLERRFGGAS